MYLHMHNICVLQSNTKLIYWIEFANSFEVASFRSPLINAKGRV